MATTWTISIDWDRNDNFSGTYDDVSSRVISANWFLGNRQPYQELADDSMLKLRLDNSDKRYSPENGSSPLAGLLKPYRPVRVQSFDGMAEPRTHWLGWIESIQPSVGDKGERVVDITAAGPMQFFKAVETDVALQENKRSDEIVDILLKQVLIPPNFIVPMSKVVPPDDEDQKTWILGRTDYTSVGHICLAKQSVDSLLDTGKTQFEIIADNWVRQGDAANTTRNVFDVYRAIRDTVAAERGRFGFNRENKAIFWNRHRFLLEGLVLLETPKATFNNTMVDMTYTYAGLEHLKNEIIVSCNPRTIGDSNHEILWELTDEVRIGAGQTRTVVARFQDDAANRVAGKNLSLSGVAFSKGSAYVNFIPKANSAELVFNNPGTEEAILSACAVIGQKITDFGRMEATASDLASIVDHGKRTLRLNLPAVDNLEDAQNIAYFERKRRSQPRGVVQTITVKSHGELGGGPHANQLALTLGDLITVQESQTGHSANYFIIGEMHRLTNGAALYETTWYLEPAPTSYPWKLNHSTRSKLDSGTILTY